jgi:hypothetical protein
VQENFSYIIYAIIGISLLAVGSIVLSVFRSAKAATEDAGTGKK